MGFTDGSTMAKTLAIVIAVSAAVSVPAFAADPSLRPAGNWSAVSGLPGEEAGKGFKKLAESLSGLACGAEVSGERHCLLAPDERTSAYFVTVKDGAVVLGPQLPLLETPGVAVNNPESKLEGDFEAVARDGNTYWVFGSHSTKRKKGKADDETNCFPEPLRRHVYRFDVDAETGLPSGPFDADHVPLFVRRFDHLPQILAAVPELAQVVDANLCADKGGINIEGATVSGGEIAVGLRAPLGKGDDALVVTFDAKAFESGGAVTPVLHRLSLAGLAIRDLAAVPGGRLVLAGASVSDDDDAKRPASSLWYWANGGDAPKKLGDLAGTPKKGAKPEALAVLEADPNAAEWRVLVLCDGVVGGAPAEYRIPRP
jgi:hypothetical protein